MRYLDEGIEVNITKPAAQYGVATFRVLANNQLIFVGKTYVLNDNSTTVTIDITDICASYRWDNWLAKARTTMSNLLVNNWITKFTVEIDIDGSTYSAYEWGMLYFRNPEMPNLLPLGSSLLQPGLQPHAPLLRTANNLFVDFFHVSGICYGNIYDGQTIPSVLPIGYTHHGYILDNCPARYYLRWMDRCGGVQSQPMDGKRVYAEDITTQEIQNVKGHRRGVQWQVQPKWQLNTGFIHENVMPNYESIFVSPYVMLYDTERDLLFDVIVTDKSYTHKTYKNDRMFNLTLNVELDKRQNILN